MSRLDDVICRAVTRRDAHLAGRLAEFFRFKLGMNYEQTYQRVSQACDVSLNEWEALLLESSRYSW